MTYATKDDLLRLASRERLIELTDRANPPMGDIDADQLDWALVQADAQINARLGVRYALPLEPAPPVLTRLAAVIAYHDLHVEEVPDKVAHDHRQALDWLDRVAKGDAPLQGGGGGPNDGPAGRAGGVRSAGSQRLFNRTALKGF